MKREASGPVIRQELPRLTSKLTAMDRQRHSVRGAACLSIRRRDSRKVPAIVSSCLT